ncbi:MAG: cytochrome C oxidase subunit I, partial [Bacteroidetes bacterium]|nr:cytochrome C oxidase subunit I [Bacteroidota bacterium]MBU1762007.1 cytochrome C oxidase subunit I [Bacteroidota bacterium]
MNIVIPQHPSLYKIVISHYLLAAINFLALAPMLALAVNDLGGHYFQPHLLAITHTAALGWGTVIIFGACYQLVPVILETELYSY